MNKITLIFFLTVFSVSSVFADSISQDNSRKIRDKVRIIEFGYDSAHSRPGYIWIKTPVGTATTDSEFYLKKSSDALLYIFTVYTQKKSIEIEYAAGLNKFNLIEKISTID
ncbi:hypothetical protein AB7038_02700 [Morganella morganii]|uniref:hypothetical protein n=1 Tax=Morganella morganii TaxID=582 RepID=UPI0034E5D17E